MSDNDFNDDRRISQSVVYMMKLLIYGINKNQSWIDKNKRKMVTQFNM